MHIPKIQHPCNSCARPTSKRCSGCRTTWYCSAEHLKEDWHRHRKECTSAQTKMDNNLSNTSNSMVVSPSSPKKQLTAVSPSSPKRQLTAVSALLFSPEEERPRIISIDILPTPTPLQNVCPALDVSKYFPNEQPGEIVVKRGLNEKELRFPLLIFFSRDARKKGAPVNRAIGCITSGVDSVTWCGTILVFRYKGTRRQGYSNASLTDLAHISEYFIKQQNC